MTRLQVWIHLAGMRKPRNTDMSEAGVVLKQKNNFKTDSDLKLLLKLNEIIVTYHILYNYLETINI